jgi:hypothetical protein
MTVNLGLFPVHLDTLRENLAYNSYVFILTACVLLLAINSYSVRKTGMGHTYIHT